MQVSLNPQVKETAFGSGKIVYPKYKRIARVLGDDILDEFKVALPELKLLEDKAIIRFQMRQSPIEEFNGFRISVSKPAKSGLRKFLGLSEGKPLRTLALLADEFYESPKKLGNIIVERVTEMVSALNC